MATATAQIPRQHERQGSCRSTWRERRNSSRGSWASPVKYLLRKAGIVEPVR